MVKKNYISAYEGIKKQAAELGIILPTHINPDGVALFNYIVKLKECKFALQDRESKTTEDKALEMLIDRAILETDTFYTDVVGHAPGHDESLE